MQKKEVWVGGGGIVGYFDLINTYLKTGERGLIRHVA